MHALIVDRTPSPTYHRQIYQARGAEGAALFVEFEANMWATKEGELRYTVILLDVTEQTKIAVELAESEFRLDFTLTGTGVGIFDQNLTDGTLTVSRTMREIFGFTDADNIDPTKDLLGRVHPDDIPTLLENNRRCIRGETAQSSSEYRITKKNGDVVWVRTVAFVSKRDRHGRALRLMGTKVNIDDHKRALEALQVSEARFRSATESAPIGTVLVASDGDILDVNEAFCTFLGYERQEVKSLHFNDLTAQVMDSRRLDTLHQSDVEFCGKDGRLVWGLLTASEVPGNDQHDSHSIVQVLDVNERRKMDDMKRDFIATVSHELRTPLTSVRSSLGMLRMNMGLQITDVTERLIVIAQNNCDRLTSLVNDILDLEKLGSQEMEIDLSAVDASDIVTQIVSDMTAYAADRDVTISLVGADSPQLVTSNQSRFAQVLTNLLSNAIKFSPVGEKVLVKVTQRDANVEVSVSDNGDGIPSAFRDRIFTRFAQANSSNTRSTGGTGLGLNISKELVESMGGQIGFTTETGQGSTFWFQFPAAELRAAS